MSQPKKKNKQNPLTINEVANWFEANEFIFAKSMPETPHWYMLKYKCTNKQMFERVVMYIREHGVEEEFFGRKYIYLVIGHWKYWTMGDPLATTILINRAKIDGV